MTATTNDHREKIITRIRALQAKAQDHSVTEVEAALLADKAAKLIAEYNLTFTDLEIAEVGYGRDGKEVSWKSGASHPVIWTQLAIGKLYNCKPWRNTNASSVTFFGTAVDTEQAHYLLQLCYNVIETELNIYKRSSDYRELVKDFGQSPRSLCDSFRKGCAARLSKRIDELAGANQEIMHSHGGTALVVAKSAALNAALKEDGICLRTGRSSAARNHGAAAAGAAAAGAAAAGAAAADRASLSRGVGQSSGPALLS